MMRFENDAIILTVGISGCGKTTWATTTFGEGAVVSSDYCRQLVCGDATRQDINVQAFALFHQIIDTRASMGVLTVADATNLTAKARQQIRDIAAKYNRPVHYVVFTTPLAQAKKWNTSRSRNVPEFVLDKHQGQLDSIATALRVEGPMVHRIDPRKPSTDVLIIPSYANVFEADGWWIVGDIHGCFTEFMELVKLIPPTHKIAFVGDYVDRGPQPKHVLNAVEAYIKGHFGKGVPGNHCWKAYRYLCLGRRVTINNGLEETLELIHPEDIEFLGELPFYMHLRVPDSDKTVTVCHAGIPFHMIGRTDRAVQGHCLYGETNGEVNPESGFPVRTYEWVNSWQDPNHICVFGHTPVREVEFMGPHGNCVNVDTGCAFGNKLTAYNPFTGEIISVNAHQTYAEREQWK